jgi:carbamoyltransferase
MNITLGLGGGPRHACAALSDGARIIAACEQERITRIRGDGLNASGLPDEAVDFLLDRRGLTRRQISKLAVGDASPAASLGEVVHFDHHQSHAAAAYLTSPFESAAVLVCDHQSPEMSLWEGSGATLARVDWPWQGPGLASLYSMCAQRMGFTGEAQAAHLEALARLRPGVRDDRVARLFQYREDSIALTTGWEDTLAGVGAPALLERGRMAEAAAISGAVQNAIGDLLTTLIRSVRARSSATRLCLAGSLFYNSHYCGLVKRAKLFDDVFVPVNPGNAGLALGAALHADGAKPKLTTPFLGPSFDSEEIKAVLDNCKLTYEWLGEHAAAARAVDVLGHGGLVGWFRGAMEWGPRALGARSIFASPFSPYVLENLNRFLKHRQPWRGYALATYEQEIERQFEGPVAAPFMECDFQPRDRERFRYVMPHTEAALRVQSVPVDGAHPMSHLLKLFGEAQGSPILVNTSFNGFSEPIVCSPRDAIRVFYGTGLDLLVMNEFVVTK